MNLNPCLRMHVHAPEVPQPSPPIPPPYPDTPPGRPTELPPGIQEPDTPDRERPPEGDPPGKPNPVVTLH